MSALELTADEATWIAQRLSIYYARGYIGTNGTRFRLRVLQAHKALGPPLRGREGREDAPSVRFAIHPEELWLLDDLCVREDLRSTKLPNGHPLMELAEKVWTALLDAAGEGARSASDQDRHTATYRGRPAATV